LILLIITYCYYFHAAAPLVRFFRCFRLITPRHAATPHADDIIAGIFRRLRCRRCRLIFSPLMPIRRLHFVTMLHAMLITPLFTDTLPAMIIDATLPPFFFFRHYVQNQHVLSRILPPATAAPLRQDTR